jgi:uncharacterized protein (TIGR03435 family)
MPTRRFRFIVFSSFRPLASKRAREIYTKILLRLTSYLQYLHFWLCIRPPCRHPSLYVTVCTITLRTFLTRSACAALSALLLLAGEFSLGAQLLQPKEPMPSFEVATIKPWRPSTVVSPVGAGRPPKEVPVGAAAPVGDRVHFIGQIELLIEAAYGLPFSSGDRILGGPDWIRSESDRYEVTGKIDDAHYATIQKTSPAQRQEQVSLMEQSLLTDRFKFSAHIETREMPGYVLVVAKGGSKLDRAQGDAKSQMSFVRNGQENELRATAVSVEELAQSPGLPGGSIPITTTSRRRRKAIRVRL